MLLLPKLSVILKQAFVCNNLYDDLVSQQTLNKIQMCDGL